MNHSIFTDESGITLGVANRLLAAIDRSVTYFSPSVSFRVDVGVGVGVYIRCFVLRCGRLIDRKNSESNRILFECVNYRYSR